MRDYVNYPSDVPVATDIGTVLVSVTDGSHVHVTTPALNVGPLLTVRGAAYYMSGHWYRDPVERSMHCGLDAVERGLAPEDTFGLYVARDGGGTVTQAARRTVEGAVQAGLDAWSADPETDRLFAEGAIAHASNTLRSLEELEVGQLKELEVTRSAIDHERATLATAEKQLAKLDHPAGKGV